MAAKAIQPNPSLVALNILFLVLYIWSIVITGIAMWKAARGGQKNWFAALLVLQLEVWNILGIIPIVYLLRFSKEKMNWKDLLFWEKKEKKNNR